MEIKKGVIGIVGTVLIVIMIIVISSPSNSADVDFDEVNPYVEVLRDIDDSISSAGKNSERMKAIDNDVESYKRQLEWMIDSYELLKGDMQRNLDGLERLGNVVDRTKLDSRNVEEKLNALKKNVEENEKKFTYDNSGIRVGPIFILAFLLINCVVWVQISGYYKKRYV